MSSINKKPSTKQNLGYRLGKKVKRQIKRFRDWEHPKTFKFLYISILFAILATIIYISLTFIVGIFLFIVMCCFGGSSNNSDNSDNSEIVVDEFDGFFVYDEDGSFYAITDD